MRDSPAAVAVMGAGSWGTAFAGICADAGSRVTLWARRPEAAAELASTRHNPRHLSWFQLPDTVTVTADAEEALAGADIVVLAIPSHALHDRLEAWAPHVPPQAIAVSLIKGVSAETKQRASQVIRALWDLPDAQVVVLSGPNLAEECARHMPGATVVAGPDGSTTAAVQRACHTDYFRVYTNADLIGVELAGAVKNPLAIAAGIADGLGYGDNTKAALMTRGLAEMTRLGLALGGNPLTFSGLAGVGDLLATCGSPRSRNRHVGEQLGRGHDIDAVLREMDEGGAVSGVPEGVRSSTAILAMAAEVGVEMPIVDQVVCVLHEGADPREVAGALMGRSPKDEFHGFQEATT